MVNTRGGWTAEEEAALKQAVVSESEARMDAMLVHVLPAGHHAHKSVDLSPPNTSFPGALLSGQQGSSVVGRVTSKATGDKSENEHMQLTTIRTHSHATHPSAPSAKRSWGNGLVSRCGIIGSSAEYNYVVDWANSTCNQKIEMTFRVACVPLWVIDNPFICITS